ncbi:type II toxin-antitoxin system PemK/MazF family toxin [Xylella fastidiosa]|uniref:type II toxin-antitoxin system PemK/MazF family toxin n=1 Tax=Xylella fastidiosa TaxID=2371 RepID=UPI001F200871|nr:type II toxin-antitoxin system PemK/MazF family toxin [Xylella fastidiosa]WNY20037.1 type II toxin-antitoxin system PemK/MazF family toxin [Xylella fastidiosa]WNY22332.1 type II toxin-antitoxin system PemK/MazF family toxin [Xylella fastidiosa]
MLRGEVWWVEFDPLVGSEIRKTRPAIILSNDAANRNLARVVVVPVTSNTGRVYPGEAVVTVGGQQSKAMADQIMAADKVRGRPNSRVTSRLLGVGRNRRGFRQPDPELHGLGHYPFIAITSSARILAERPLFQYLSSHRNCAKDLPAVFHGGAICQ